MENLFTSIKDKAPELLKENKGAIIGAVVGAFLVDSKQAQNAILGAVAGNLLVDNNDSLKKPAIKIPKDAEPEVE